MQIMEIRSGCGLPLATLQTWLIPQPGDGARSFLIRSTVEAAAHGQSAKILNESS
jgi:hypothetical protein